MENNESNTVRDVVCFRQSSHSCVEGRKTKQNPLEDLKMFTAWCVEVFKGASTQRTLNQKKKSLLNASDSGFDIWQQKYGKSNDKIRMK